MDFRLLYPDQFVRYQRIDFRRGKKLRHEWCSLLFTEDHALGFVEDVLEDVSNE